MVEKQTNKQCEGLATKPKAWAWDRGGGEWDWVPAF